MSPSRALKPPVRWKLLNKSVNVISRTYWNITVISHKATAQLHGHQHSQLDTAGTWWWKSHGNVERNTEKPPANTMVEKLRRLETISKLKWRNWNCDALQCNNPNMVNVLNCMFACPFPKPIKSLCIIWFQSKVWGEKLVITVLHFRSAFQKLPWPQRPKMTTFYNP